MKTSGTQKEPEKSKGIPGSTLKMIALISMLIDHIGAVVLEAKLIDLGMGEAMESQQGTIDFMAQYGTLYITDIVLRFIGRIAFPIFCFLLVEGFMHTRSRFKYGRNLLLFALISEIPFNLAIARSMGDTQLAFGVLYPDYQNVFFTLFIGLLCLCGYEWASRYAKDYRKDSKTVALSWILRVTGIVFPAMVVRLMLYNYFGIASDLIGWGVGILVPLLIYAVSFLRTKDAIFLQTLCTDMTILALGMLLADTMKTDYSSIGILAITMMYAFRKDRVKSAFVGCAALIVFNYAEITSIFALAPIKKYNGERGLGMKYFFYVFYPVHLFLLYLISVYLV